MKISTPLDPWRSGYLRVETQLPAIVIEGRAGISYNLVFVQ